MLRKLILVLAFAGMAWLPAQTTNIDLTALTGNSAFATDLKNGLINPLTGLLATGYAKGVPFTAAAGNYIPNRYHFLIPLVDFYISGPVLVGAGAMDKTYLDKMKGNIFGDQIYKSLNPYAQFLYAPVPVLAVSMAARIDLPILKMFELQVKFGQVPGQVKDLMKSLTSSMPGIALDLDASCLGIGVRVNLINTTLFQLAVSGNYDTLNTKANIEYTIKDMVLNSDANGKLTQDLTFALTNQYQSTVFSANLHASINLAILQIYGGVGLNMDLSAPYSSSFAVSGPLKYTPTAGTPMTAFLPNGQIGSIYQRDSVTIPRSDIIPKFALGVRLLVIDIQAESTFDFSAVAARAGIALSF